MAKDSKFTFRVASEDIEQLNSVSLQYGVSTSFLLTKMVSKLIANPARMVAFLLDLESDLNK